MILLDGFSGYGGFHKGLLDAGFVFDKTYFSEIDKHAIANYKQNFPNSEYAGSITDIDKSTVNKIDFFTFGWPCQDNSTLGNRAGQGGGTRSGLLYQAARIINLFKPRNFFAENVKGLLTVNKGVDIIESLRLLTYFNDCLPQYEIEMQLLNTRWVLPQNRERVYFVGHLRGSGSRKIFPIGEDDLFCNRSVKNKKEIHEPAQTMTARQYASWNGNYLIAKQDVGGNNIRAFTPLECERLQGLPDNWTKYGNYDGVVKELSDAQRYRLTGNGVSKDIVQAIGRKFLKLNG